MLNLNKVGRPLAKIEGGTYNGMIFSVSDHFASNADDDEDQNGLIKEFRQLKIANAASSSTYPTPPRRKINSTSRDPLDPRKAPTPAIILSNT